MIRDGASPGSRTPLVVLALPVQSALECALGILRIHGEPMYRTRMTGTLALLAAMLASCTAWPAPSAPPTAIPATLPVPAMTSTPEATLLPTDTEAPTLTPTAAPSSTPSPAFTDLKVLNFEVGSFGVRISLTLPGASTPYSLAVAGNPFSCEPVDGIPNRMSCLGSKVPPHDRPIDLVFSDPLSGEVAYTTTITLPSQIFPALLPTHSNSPPRDPSCPPVNSKTLQCAFECRIADGDACVAATCWDSCGYAFSVHTCPQSMEPPWVWCTADQAAEQKALYGIP